MRIIYTCPRCGFVFSLPAPQTFPGCLGAADAIEVAHELRIVRKDRDALATQVMEIRLALEDPTETRADELAARVAGLLCELTDDVANLCATGVKLEQERDAARERWKNVLADLDAKHAEYVRERDLRFAADERVAALTDEVARLRRELDAVPARIAAALEACARKIYEDGTEPFPGTEGDYPSQGALQAARDAGTARGLARREGWDALQEMLTRAFQRGVEHATGTVIVEEKGGGSRG